MSTSVHQAKDRREAQNRVRMGAPCCGDAQRVFCVCLTSVVCPRHGQICIGSHD